jgi:hypothetical protein
LLNEIRAPRRALRIATRLMLSTGLLVGAAACSKTPDGPGSPGRPAPKTAVTLPQPSTDAPTGAIRIPASPADSSAAPALPRKPTRIWI